LTRGAMLNFVVKLGWPMTTEAFCPFENAKAIGATKTVETNRRDNNARLRRARPSFFSLDELGEFLKVRSKF